MLAKIVKWEFWLNGYNGNLSPFPISQSNLYFNISGGIDDYNDCISDDFRLTSVYFDEENDAEIVWQIGYELLSLYNGVSSIIDKENRKLTLPVLLHNGGRVLKSPRRNTFALLGRPSISSLLYNQEFQKAKNSNTRFLMINLATEREDVYLILKYFDLDGSYINYYKILETLESLSKKTEILISIDKSLRKRFTNTANNYTLSGLDSRHGFKEVIKENKTPSMDLHEAHSFVASIAQQYLNNLANGIICGKYNKSFNID